MSRKEQLKLVKKHVKNKNLVKHMIATENVLEDLAVYLEEDKKKWATAGLLHDIDYDNTAEDPKNHSLLGAEILEKAGFEDDIVYAVKVHNPAHGFERKSKLDKALYCADPVTGLIVASALIHPDKKLNSIDTPFVLKRFNEKQFARGANRDQISACSELGLSLDKFVSLALEAMQKNHKELGL
ncbi:HDIG domain-containing metalloprotein [Proteinivorax hydrogeniformans]|uniref:HDIG domain-containing metalloprotein n=1 Tax=Proteinivorax hydrogeniformans TaxID=1826727 RepID=A0AAU8HV76_9FIRM